MLNGFFAVGAGAALGAWSRWGLAVLLNSGPFSLGILTANLVGAYLMGLSIPLFLQMTNLSPEFKLFVVTGFLGGLTTFSSFSGEAFNLLHRQQYGIALMHIFCHVVGSILMTFLGYLTIVYFRNH